MNKDIEIIKESSIIIINLKTIIYKIQLNLIKECFDTFGSFDEIILFNSDVKKIYLNLLLYEICEFLLKYKSKKYTKVFVIDPTIKLMNLDIFSYVSPNQFYKETCDIFRKKKKLFPILIVFDRCLNLSKLGKREEIIQKINTQIKTFYQENMFTKIKKQIQKEGLNFMNIYYNNSTMINLFINNK